MFLCWKTCVNPVLGQKESTLCTLYLGQHTRLGTYIYIAYAQPRQSLRFWRTQSMDVDGDSEQNLKLLTLLATSALEFNPLLHNRAVDAFEISCI